MAPLNGITSQGLAATQGKPLPTREELFTRLDADKGLLPEERRELEKLALEATYSRSSFARFESRFIELTGNDRFSVEGAQGATVKQRFDTTIAAAEAQLAQGGPNQAKLAEEVNKLKTLYALITQDGAIGNTGFFKELDQFNRQVERVNGASTTSVQDKTRVDAATTARNAAQVSFDDPLKTNKAALKELLAQIQPLIDKANSGGALTSLERMKLDALTQSLTRNTETSQYTSTRVGELMGRLGDAYNAGTIDDGEFKQLAEMISKITSRAWGPQSVDLLNGALTKWEQAIEARIASGPIVTRGAATTASTATTSDTPASTDIQL